MAILLAVHINNIDQFFFCIFTVILRLLKHTTSYKVTADMRLYVNSKKSVKTLRHEGV